MFRKCFEFGNRDFAFQKRFLIGADALSEILDGGLFVAGDKKFHTGEDAGPAMAMCAGCRVVGYRARGKIVLGNFIQKEVGDFSSQFSVRSARLLPGVGW